jgi:hypothetical protein
MALFGIVHKLALPLHKFGQMMRYMFKTGSLSFGHTDCGIVFPSFLFYRQP